MGKETIKRLLQIDTKIRVLQKDANKGDMSYLVCQDEINKLLTESKLITERNQIWSH